MNFTFALTQLSRLTTSFELAQELENEDRVRISRTRRAIDMHEHELVQLALLEERQFSA